VTKFSSALLMVGPAQVGIFGDDLWRVGLTSQLVVGGSNGPFWLSPVTGQQGKEESALLLESTDTSVIVDSVVILGSIASNDDQALGILRDSHNLVDDAFGEHVAPYWELTPSTRQQLLDRIVDRVRLGFVLLESESLLDQRFFECIRETGLKTEVYFR
jgi:hypothetical protein